MSTAFDSRGQHCSVHSPRGFVSLRVFRTPALGLMDVKELLSTGEAACSDLINSTRIKLLCHKGLFFALSEEAEDEEKKEMKRRRRGNRLNQLQPLITAHSRARGTLWAATVSGQKLSHKEGSESMSSGALLCSAGCWDGGGGEHKTIRRQK